MSNVSQVANQVASQIVAQVRNKALNSTDSRGIGALAIDQLTQAFAANPSLVRSGGDEYIAQVVSALAESLKGDGIGLGPLQQAVVLTTLADTFKVGSGTQLATNVRDGLTALSEALPAMRAAADEPFSLVPGNVTAPLDDVAVNFTPNARAGQIVRAGNKALPNVFTVEASITDVAADIVCVPRHTTVRPPGGIEAGFINVADDRGGDVGKFTKNALSSWNQTIRESGGRVAAGFVDVACTQMDRESGAKYFLNGGTVPGDSSLRSDAPNAKETRGERMAFVRRSIEKFLFEAEQLADRDGFLPQPVRIALPAISTGPEAALSFQEAGAVLRDVLADLERRRPGQFEVIIPLARPGDAKAQKLFEDFRTVLAGRADPSEGGTNLQGPSELLGEAARDQFQIIRGSSAPVPEGTRKIDMKYVEQESDAILNQLLGKTSQLPANLRGDRSLAREAKVNGAPLFPNSALREAWSQIDKLLELPQAAEAKFGLLGGPGRRDSGGFQDVSQEAVAGLLNSPRFREAVQAEVAGALGLSQNDGVYLYIGADGQNGKMGEIVAAAAAKVLLTARMEFIEQTLPGLQSAESAAADALQAQVDELNRALRSSQLDASMMDARVREQTSIIQELESTIRQLNRRGSQEVEQLEARVRDLTAKLQRTSAPSLADDFASNLVRAVENRVRTEERRISTTQSSVGGG